MAGEFKVNGVSFATESGGTLTVNNSKVRLPSSGNGIEDSSGNSVLSESGGKTSINLTGDFVPSQPMMFRNKIINGDMRIDQRNGGSAVTTAGSFPVDRFGVLHSTDGAFSAQQDSSAPSGFTNSIKWTTTTADSSLAATQHALVRQRVEGNNIYDLGFGTASAKTITLSFWTKSSLTGTFGGSFLNNGQTRCYPFSYTISSANTWEHKTITIAGDTDTSITWLTNNSIGLEIFWSMGVGSDYDGTAGAWTSTPYQYSATGAVSVIGTLNANWYLTGVQLEVGSSVTPFEHRPTDIEFSLCKRYYEIGTFNAMGYCQGSTYQAGGTAFWHEKRAIPTCAYTGTRAGGSNNLAGTEGGNISHITTNSAHHQTQSSGSGVSYVLKAVWSIESEL